MEYVPGQEKYINIQYHDVSLLENMFTHPE